MQAKECQQISKIYHALSPHPLPSQMNVHVISTSAESQPFEGDLVELVVGFDIHNQDHEVHGDFSNKPLFMTMRKYLGQKCNNGTSQPHILLASINEYFSYNYILCQKEKGRYLFLKNFSERHYLRIYDF